MSYACLEIKIMTNHICEIEWNNMALIITDMAYVVKWIAYNLECTIIHNWYDACCQCLSESRVVIISQRHHAVAVARSNTGARSGSLSVAASSSQRRMAAGDSSGAMRVRRSGQAHNANSAW